MTDGTDDPVLLVGLGVPDAAVAWEAIGCSVVDGAVPFANGALLLGRSGIVVAGPCDATVLEGVPLATGDLVPAAVHRTLGLVRRRIRETDTVRQAFHRFADPPERTHRGCIVEIVESDRVQRTTLMGVVLNVTDLFDLADRLGPDVMSLPKPAVQPGRYIATVRRDVGLGTAVALMTP